MFWKREKTVRVELVNPEIRLQAEQTAPPPESSNQPTAPAAAPLITLELSLKLVALAAVAMQGLLAVYGYCALAGEYDAFGISMSELDVGMASLLFYGYISLLLDTVIPLGVWSREVLVRIVFEGLRIFMPLLPDKANRGPTFQRA